MLLPPIWELFLKDHLNLAGFYADLSDLINESEQIIPASEQIFNVFNFMQPSQVKAVLFGEDPYPRISSANGVAFWDAEIKSWDDKTNGNSLKNMLKAILVSKKLASYHTPISECRTLAKSCNFYSPPDLFRLWLEQGILLVNTALTFSTSASKRRHFEFWRPFQVALICALNNRTEQPYYILWGKKAQSWEPIINDSMAPESKIILQGHPTFIHQFLRKEEPTWSPFTEIEKLTGLNWF